jgi:hypothetical protein
MSLTCGVSNTLNVLLVFDTWKKKKLRMGKIDMCYTFLATFFSLNSWYLHLLVYYKHMLNFQWGYFVD